MQGRRKRLVRPRNPARHRRRHRRTDGPTLVGTDNLANMRVGSLRSAPPAPATSCAATTCSSSFPVACLSCLWQSVPHAPQELYFTLCYRHKPHHLHMQHSHSSTPSSTISKKRPHLYPRVRATQLPSFHFTSPVTPTGSQWYHFSQPQLHGCIYSPFNDLRIAPLAEGLDFVTSGHHLRSI